MDGSLDGGATPNDTGHRRAIRWRIAAWAGVASLLLLPAVAMPFTEAVNWTVSDFAVAGGLLFGALGIYELAVRMTDDTMYRAGAGVAIAAAVLLMWVNGAVGLTDSAADGLYLGVVAVGLIGAVIVRFRPQGMAYAMGTAALAHAVIDVGALAIGIAPAYNSAFEVLGLTGVFVALFAGSVGLFWQAARGRFKGGTA